MAGSQLFLTGFIKLIGCNQFTPNFPQKIINQIFFISLECLGPETPTSTIIFFWKNNENKKKFFGEARINRNIFKQYENNNN